MRTRKLALSILTGFVVWAFVSAAAPAQEPDYVIGPGDVLSISVWRHPELDRNVVVRSNGKITFPPIGELTAAGQSPNELGRDLGLRLRDFTRETTQVTVSIEQHNSRSVYVTGQVAVPGRYSFERIPDILQLLTETGGALPSADLSAVSIIRPTITGPEVTTVDVGAYMRGQRRTPLPELRPGDTVDVPSILGGGGLGGPGVVYIFGEVGAPGAYPAGDGIDLMQLVSLAGGTTPTARLNEVSVVMDGGRGGQVVAKIDLDAVIRHGTASPFELEAGDRVFVPQASTGLGGRILGGVTTVLNWSRDIMSAYLLYLTIDREIDDRQAREDAAAAAAAAAATAN
jgi:polysaccharide export outer membrane protein